MKFTLEDQKFFPYIAWFTVIGFAFFVAHLSFSLHDELTTLQAQTNQTVYMNAHN